MSPDKNVEAVRTKLLERSQVGLAKYGVTTERTDTDLVGWLNHLQEELMDAAVYVQRSMVEIEAQKAELEAARKDAEKFKLLVGEMRDGMVVWFDVNPHGAPEGTQYYVSIVQAKGGVK